MWYVDFLKSGRARWYYVGSTNRLKERVSEHNLGKVISTKAYIPLNLVHHISFATEKEARDYERKVKDVRREKEGIIKEIENKL